MTRILLIFLGSICFVSFAEAQVIGSCNSLSRPQHVVAANRTYYDGRVELVHVDTGGEPSCCSSRLLIKIHSKLGERCFSLGSDYGSGPAPLGFYQINYSGMGTDDTNDGLIVTVPVFYDETQDEETPVVVRIFVGKSKISVTLPEAP